MTVDAVHDALVARLARDPDDLDAAAVLADHLSALGDPRGELIAVELAIASATPAQATERGLLARRAALQARLAVPVGRADIAPTFVWRLGYVRRLEVAAPDACGFAWEHPSLQLLRELAITFPFDYYYSRTTIDELGGRLPRALHVLELRHSTREVADQLAACVPGLASVHVWTARGEPL